MSNLCGNQSSESNRAGLRYIFEDEACWGATPTSGVTRDLRITNSSLVPSKETALSSELRADRMVSNIVETAASSGGDIEWEFSAGSQDDFFQAFLLGHWTRPMTYDFFQGDTVSWTANNVLTVSGGDYTGYFVVGRRYKTEGFLDPANNGYFEVASVAFAGGVTNVTMTTTTSVVEAGATFSKIVDANDAIIANDATIRFGTGGASTIDSNGNNAFASAITAKQLVVGQKIYVSGTGYDVGTVTFAGTGADGDTITINDGMNTVIFELDNNGAFNRAHVQVAIGASANETAANLQAAIMKQLNEKKVVCAASVSAAVVTIKNIADDQAGNGSITDVCADATVVDFTGGDNTVNGIFTITNAQDDVLTVTPAPNTVDATGTKVTIKGSHLRNPSGVAQITKQSFTIETGYTDVGQYFIQDGLRVGTFSMSLESGDFVTGQFGLQGKETKTNQTPVLTGAGYTALEGTATEVMNATTNVGNVYKNGIALATAVMSIEVEGENNLRIQTGVSNKFPIGIGVGRFNLNGKIVAYFETLDFYNDFLNHTTISLGWDFRDNDDNYYYFSVPAAKITTDPISPNGIDEDVMEEMEWVAQRDPNLKTQFMIDRFSSLLPATN